MRTSSCSTQDRRMRCRTPLIQICDSTTQIKVDLLSCGICATTPTALMLQLDGCPQYETVCEEVEPKNCCPTGYPYNRRLVTREVPRPTVIYPLHEIDGNGLSVFVLDGKLKKLGHGRYRGVILVEDQETELRFDVEYVGYVLGVSRIYNASMLPSMEVC